MKTKIGAMRGRIAYLSGLGAIALIAAALWLTLPFDTPLTAQASETVAVTGDDGERPRPMSTSPPVVTIEPWPFLGEEGIDPEIYFHLRRTGSASNPLTVNVSASEEGGSMLDDNRPATVTFPAGANFIDLGLALDNDQVSEPSSTVTARVEPGDGYTVGDPGSAEIIVADDDEQVVTIERSPPESVSEADGSVTFTLRRIGNLREELRVNVSVSEDGSMLGDDQPTTVTFPAGLNARSVRTPKPHEFDPDASSAATLQVPLDNDNVGEPSSTISASVVAGDGYTVGTPASAQVIVTDDEPVVTIVRISPRTVSEGFIHDVIFALLRRGDNKDALTVYVDVQETGDMLVPDRPYRVPVTFPACITNTAVGNDRITIVTCSSATELGLTLDNDDVDEGKSTVTLSVVEVEGGGYTVGSPASAQIIVTDNDETGVVTIERTPPEIEYVDPFGLVPIDRPIPENVSEASGSVSFTLRRAGDEWKPVTVDVEVTETGSMLVPDTPHTVQVTFGPCSGPPYPDGRRRTICYRTTTLDVALQDDNMGEENSTVTVRVVEVPGRRYEVGSPASATVIVTDDDDSTERQTQEEPASNRSPQFVSFTPTRDVPENSAAGTNVGAPVTATDPDGDTLTYSLSGTSSGLFTIDSSGQIAVATGASLDYETTSQYTITVQADDGRSGFAAAIITVNVTDVDENRAPQFGSLTPTRDVPENSAAGTNVGAPVTATDPDGDTLTYTLSGTGAALFTIDSSGQIKVATGANLDYETTASYTITVEADDSNGGTASVAITVNITDVDENRAPQFGSLTPTRDVPENSAAGTAVGAPVTATDPDGDTLIYTLSGTGSGLFTIDSSGQIKVADGTTLDYETTQQYTITVQADDGNGGTGSVAITVNVTDVDENRAPVFIYAYKRGVDENSPAGTNVGVPVTANDPDGDPVAYSLSGADSGLFTIDASGQIAVGEGTVLDHETTPQYSVTVQADDGNGGTASVPITVNVRDVDETNYPPQFIHAIKRGVFENSAAGTNVGKPVTASDPNGDAIAYSLSGTGSDLFTIDANGQIKVGEGTSLDHETTPSYAITVHANDGNGGTDSVNITVNVKDVND